MTKGIGRFETLSRGTIFSQNTICYADGQWAGFRLSYPPTPFCTLERGCL